MNAPARPVSSSRAQRAFGAATRRLSRYSSTRIGRRAQAGFVRCHVFMYRLLRGRMVGRLGGAPLMLLTTTGRRSGKRRTVPLIYAPGPEPVLVASNGGAASHPLWFRNAMADPQVRVEIGSRKFVARLEAVSEAERPLAWARAVAVYPSYADYQEATARELPVLVVRETHESSAA